MSTKGLMVEMNGHSFNIEHVVEIDYTNYRGERAKRVVVPCAMVVASGRRHPDLFPMSFEETPHHKPAQFVFRAFDIRKGAERTYALNDLHSWRGLTATEAQRELEKLADDAHHQAWVDRHTKRPVTKP